MARHPLVRRALLVACAALLGGCTSSYQSLQAEHPAAPTPTSSASRAVTAWSHLFLFGFVGSVHSDVRDFCDGGAVSSVRVGTTPWTVALSLVTLGLYTPVEQSYVCARWTSETTP